MKKVLIGSQALKIWFPSEPYLAKRGRDIDYIVDGPFERVIGDDSKDVSKYPGLMLLHGRAVYHEQSDQWLLLPSDLYTLKLSHSFWNVKFPKTITDIKWFQEKGIQYDEELFQVLYQDWVVIHGKKRAYLNVSKEEFFKDNVNRKYDHDSIHAAIMYGDEPMYKKILKDGHPVLTDGRKFARLSEEDKIRTISEEAFVTSLERFLIPSDFKDDPNISYKKACQLLCTSMTQGHFAKAIVLRWNRLHEPDIDYVSRFKSRIGVLKEKV